MERKTMETIKGDTHDALDEVKTASRPAARSVARVTTWPPIVDTTKRDVRDDDDADGI